jgi:hypothetical protein
LVISETAAELFDPEAEMTNGETTIEPSIESKADIDRIVHRELRLK